MPAPVADYFRYMTGPGGFSPIGVSGILGSLEQESGFDPNAFNAKEGAIGLGQWRGPRAEAMRRHVANSSLPPALAQLEFLSREVDQYKGLRQRLNTARTPEEAAYIFAREYERPKVIEPARLSNAKKFYTAFADPTYAGAKGMTAERGTTDAPKPITASRESRALVDEMLGVQPKEAAPPPAKPTANDPDVDAVLGFSSKSVAPAKRAPGATGEWDAPEQTGVLQAVDNAGRAFGAAFGGDYLAAAGNAAIDQLRGDPRTFSENYKQNLAAEQARTQRAENQPGLGAIGLPEKIGPFTTPEVLAKPKINVNPALLGYGLAGAAQSMLLPGAGLAAKLPFAGGVASGAVQGGELALAQLAGQAGSNWLAGDAPIPNDFVSPAATLIGSTAGGAMADILGYGLKAATNMTRRTPELRSVAGSPAAKQMLDAAQDAAQGQPGGAGARLSAIAERPTVPANDMLADQPEFRAVVLGNALEKPLGPAKTVPAERFAARQAAIVEEPRRQLQQVFAGNIDDAIAGMRATRDQQAKFYYEQAGLPRVDMTDIPAAQRVMREAPIVPNTPELRRLTNEPQFQSMLRLVRRDPLFRNLPENNLAVLDQVYKMFNDGIDPRLGQATRAYARTGQSLKAMTAQAITADGDFQAGQAYAMAVRNFATNRAAEQAVDLGRRVSSWTPDDRLRIKGMSDAERDALRMGVADRLRTQLEGKTPQQTRTFLGKGALRNDMDAAFGPEDAGAFLGSIEEYLPQMQTNAMFGNSQTAEKLRARERATSQTPMTREGALNYLLRWGLNKMTPNPTTGATPASREAIVNDLLTRTDPQVNIDILRDLLGLGRAEEASTLANRLYPGVFGNAAANRSNGQ